jgi:hypothetical protein
MDCIALVRFESRIPNHSAASGLEDLVETVILSGYYSYKRFPIPLRRIKYRNPKMDKRLIFLTNQFNLLVLSIADLYRCRKTREPIRIDRRTACRDAGPWPAVQRLNAHPAHQRRHVSPADLVTFPPQPVRKLPGAVQRQLQVRSSI